MKIYKFIILFISIVAYTTTVKAQYVNYDTEYSIGFQGGLVESKMSFYPYNPSQSYKQAFCGGIRFRAITEKYFGTQIELNYVSRGWKENSDQYTFQHQLTYLELPLLTHVTFGNQYLRWFCNLGPSFSYLLYDDIKGLNFETYAKDEPQHNQSIKNKFDYGVVGGMGLEYRSPIGPIQIEARYNFGLGDLFSNNSSDPVRTSRSNYLSFTFGYMFTFTKDK